MLKRFAVPVALLPVKALSAAISGYSAVIGSFSTAFEGLAEGYLKETVESRQRVVRHNGTSMAFSAPNRTCIYRARDFATKEPETLRWIDEHGGNGAFFDIGANIGAYSIYHGLTKAGAVYAFEPSVFNLRTLVRNINLNGLGRAVQIVPNPLSATSGWASFRLASTEEGGALAAFGVDYGYDGRPIDTIIEYQALGYSLDDLMGSGLISHRPALVKIDVDGIENLILRGARQTLSDPSCRSVLVEINEALEVEGREVVEILSGCGLTLASKHQPAGFAASEVNRRLFNQIWLRA